MGRAVGKKWVILLPALTLLAAACGSGNGNGSGSVLGSKAQTLVGIAASDGVGIGALRPDSDNWVARLGAHLPSGTHVVNLGISGATVAQSLEQELPVAIDARPNLAAVWLGVNDFQQGVSLTAFSSSLEKIITRLHSDARTSVFVGNLPDLRQLNAFAGRDPAALDAEVRRWNAEIARVAGAQNASVVDVYAAWTATKDRAGLVSSDGLHPTTAGYQRIADLFWQAMLAAP